MYRIAMVAGHFKGTAGKRIPKALDPNETREWELNARICDKVEVLLNGYTGYGAAVALQTGLGDQGVIELLLHLTGCGAGVGMDIGHDATSLPGLALERIVVDLVPLIGACSVRSGNTFSQGDVFLAGGIVEPQRTPLAEANFYTLRNTNMPAVLLELGFMDSTVDAPIILSEEYADKCAEAIVAVMVKRGGLKKQEAVTAAPKSVNATEKARSGPLASLKGTYKVTAENGLNIRNGAGKKANEYGDDKHILTAIPEDFEVRCWGYYTEVGGVKWLYVEFTYEDVAYTGFACETYLRKV